MVYTREYWEAEFVQASDDIERLAFERSVGFEVAGELREAEWRRDLAIECIWVLREFEQGPSRVKEVRQ